VNTIDEIDDCLPQTQCQSCTFIDCRDYATAITLGNAKINQCPPGGDFTLERLASITGIPTEPINEQLKSFDGFAVAKIIESECIGCTKCIQACPVDAIIGSGKRMHSVLEDHCTGCELCLPPCPVDCIVMQPVAVDNATWQGIPSSQVESFRNLRSRHHLRQVPDKVQKTKNTTPIESQTSSSIKAEILAAVSRRRHRRSINTSS
jgi:electron transport complex protein RnfB